MTAREPVVPEAEWGKFLRDSEEAIRRSAPREPSARERASGAGVDDTVGEVWCPEEPAAGPAWRQLDPAARVRRAARFLGLLTVLLVLLTLFRHAQPAVPSP
ncbi:hypothetical protein [Streptomyces galbus]|uniref:DUF3040 domain-containing protein n=1 Tax=Streptomyces galbus TaxID=33898 RepID=A0A4U5X7W6_STRGB|nr:hypothetical protein [Streptomyces galbus]TKT11369.1 hypothetical protein E4U92_02540 [Streptomyces galbus]GHD39483.1 hypothetical protein GCM10010335_39480 [Streptomyces galbus]